MRRGSFIFSLLISSCVHGALFAALREGVFGEPVSRDGTEDILTTTLTFTPTSEAALLPEQSSASIEATPAIPLSTVPPPVLPPQRVLEQSPKPPPTSEPELLKAGIDDGAESAKSWQGFKEETPNAAPVLQVEQSAMTPKKGVDSETIPGESQAEASEQSATNSAATASEPKPSEAANSEQVDTNDGRRTEEVRLAEAEATKADAPQEQPRKALESVDAPARDEVQPSVERAIPGETPQALKDLPPASTEDSLATQAATGRGDAERIAPAEAPEAAASKASEPSSSSAAEPEIPAPTESEVVQALREVRANSGNQTPKVEGSGLGEIEPEESDASALKATLAIEPGKTLAREGIQIRTVRPRWSVTTKITAVPRNPLIDITFDRSGRVSKAEFVQGKDSGSREVDGPLLDSIYRWRASGENFEKSLNKGSKVTLRFRMLLKEEDDSNRLPIPADKAR